MKYIDTYASPLGVITLMSDGEYLTHLAFEGQKYYSEYMSGDIMHNELPVIKCAKEWLDTYFNGHNPDPFLQIKLEGTPFQRDVWELLRKIPYGKTVTYGALARELAEQKGIARMSAQAVGNAVGKNLVSIIVPCHRVVGADGSLVGYAAGVDKKLALLRLEKILK